MSVEEIFQEYNGWLSENEELRFFTFKKQEEEEGTFWFERVIIWKSLCEIIDPRKLVEYVKDKILLAIEDGEIKGW